MRVKDILKMSSQRDQRKIQEQYGLEKSSVNDDNDGKHLGQSEITFIILSIQINKKKV